VTLDGVNEDQELLEFEERPSAFSALYAHWERTQWSALELDLSTDARTFSALSREQRDGLVWIFAHRFHAEFNVASLLAPFLLRAPNYDVQLLLATQVADEHRHLQAVLRIYREVFGVDGGIDAVKELADRNLDPVAETLWTKLHEYVGALLHPDADADTFLRAVIVYHLLGEGVVARTAQNLAAGQYERFGAFPGLTEGQRLVARDEARHIGIGVSFVRQRLDRDEEGHARAVIKGVIDELTATAVELLATANSTGMAAIVRKGYGVAPEGFFAEAMRLTQLRLRSLGLLEESR